MYNGKPVYFDDANEAQLMRDLIAGPLSDSNIEETARQVSASKGYFAIVNDAFIDDSADGTLTTVTSDDVDTWLDVNLVTTNVYDERPEEMTAATAGGVTGAGTTADPFVFQLEGLTTASYGDFRANFKFNPDEDNGEVSVRLMFHRHSGQTPATFTIEDIAGSLAQGAEIDYALNPGLSFFIDDTIDTNGKSDAGNCCFQIKSSVPGELRMAGMAWYIFA